jgi:hypothetical protein
MGKLALVLALTLAAVVVPAEAATTRATGILLNYAGKDGGLKPALFSLPGYAMPMTECRRVLRGQTRLLRASLRSDREFFGLRYVNSKCVYLDTDPLGIENQD